MSYFSLWEFYSEEWMMKLLLVGNGGRECALAWKISQSNRCDKLYITKANAGQLEYGESIDIAPLDIEGVVNFSVNNKIDLVVVAPDDPLYAGMVDALNEAGIRAFGPVKKAATIEGSKVFSKNLMKKYGVPTAFYEVFDNSEEAKAYIKKNNKFPIVIKAEGLALGKGVIIAEDLETAVKAVDDIMVAKQFGESGNRVVIEEFLTGREITVLAFCDGKTLKTMPSSQDYKRALTGNKGLNTGGMGAISPSPIYTQEIEEYCQKEVYQKTLDALNAEGITFKGVIYFGLINTPDGIKVIEYNARFGDPETQVILPQLETDILDIFDACIDGTLDNLDIKWNNRPTQCVVLASGGYPSSYEKNKEITGLDKAKEDGANVFIAGAYEKDGKAYTNGGRVLVTSATGETADEAYENAYNAIGKINFENCYYRTDIGLT